MAMGCGCAGTPQGACATVALDPSLTLDLPPSVFFFLEEVEGGMSV